MAAAPPVRPASPMPTPSTPKRRNTSDGVSTGLRNSCEACASSKVKCTGRKPTCHRCEKRGFTCEYFQAKRAGRKPAGSAGAASNSGSSSGGGGGTASQPASEAESSREVVVAAEAYASPPGAASELSDIWRDVNPLDASLFSDLSNINETSTGLTPSFSLELPALDAAAPTAPMTSNSLYSSTMDEGLGVGLGNMSAAAIEASNDAAADLFAFPLPTPRATSLISPVDSGSRSLDRSPSVPHMCSCLAQALGLMRRLSELMCSTRSAATTDSDEDAIRTIQHILQQNKAAVNAAVMMLNCQGRHDGYLLIIICLTIFKTLELFAAALPERSHSNAQSAQRRRQSLGSSQLTTRGDDYHIEGRDWARQSAQAILGELHGVRRLTRLLSEKLRVQTTATPASSLSRTSSTTAPTPTGPQDVPVPSSKESSVSETEARLPFSAEVYRQLEVDLDSRVIALSQQIIHRLRSF